MTDCLAMLVCVLHLILEAVFHTILSRESMKQPTSIWNQVFLTHCDIPLLHCFHMYVRKVFLTGEIKWVSIFHFDLSL